VDVVPEVEGTVKPGPEILMIPDDGATLPNPVKDPEDVKLVSILLLAVLVIFCPTAAVIKGMLKMSFFIFLC
jgi:hypothetical protein